MGILLLEPQQDAKGAEVGAKFIQVLRGHLTRHDALPDPAAGKGGDHLGELADLEPYDVVHQRGECGIGLVLNSDRDEPTDALEASLPREDQWEGTITGYDAEGVWPGCHG